MLHTSWEGWDEAAQTPGLDGPVGRGAQRDAPPEPGAPRGAVCGAEPAAATPPRPHPRGSSSSPHIHHGLTAGKDQENTQWPYVAVSLLRRILVILYKLSFQLPSKKQQVWGRQTLETG